MYTYCIDIFNCIYTKTRSTAYNLPYICGKNKLYSHFFNTLCSSINGMARNFHVTHVNALHSCRSSFYFSFAYSFNYVFYGELFRNYCKRIEAHSSLVDYGKMNDPKHESFVKSTIKSLLFVFGLLKTVVKLRIRSSLLDVQFEHERSCCILSGV